MTGACSALCSDASSFRAVEREPPEFSYRPKAGLTVGTFVVRRETLYMAFGHWPPGLRLTRFPDILTVGLIARKTNIQSRQGF